MQRSQLWRWNDWPLLDYSLRGTSPFHKPSCFTVTYCYASFVSLDLLLVPLSRRYGEFRVIIGTMHATALRGISLSIPALNIKQTSKLTLKSNGQQ